MLGTVARVEAPFGPHTDLLGDGPYVCLYTFNSDRFVAASEGTVAEFLGENLEKRYVEVGLDTVEIGVNSGEGGNIGCPCLPMGVFVGGVFNRVSRAGLCLSKAELMEEIISGLGCTSTQGCGCG